MILKKLAGAIRKQDWFTVLVEISVVVIGIFLGLQVDAWNQARLDQDEASYHLNFLFDELVVAIEQADAEIARSEVTLMNSFQASALLTQDAWSEEEEAGFKQAVSSTYRLWGPRARPVSLRRLIDDGKLDLIEKDLQKAILKYESAYIDAINQTETAYSYSVTLSPKITASMRFKGPNIVSSAEELLANEALKSAVRDKAVWQRIQLDVLESLQVERRNLKQMLEEHSVGVPADRS